MLSINYWKTTTTIRCYTTNIDKKVGNGTPVVCGGNVKLQWYNHIGKQFDSF